MRRGDIYFVSKHSTTGAEIAKSRPAVIVSDNTLNATSGVVEVVFLTTQPKREMHTHATIHSTGRESVALCEQVNTVDRSRLGDYFGRCTEDEMARIDHALLASLGLTGAEPKPADPPLSEDLVDVEEALIRLEAERDVYKELYEKTLDRVVSGR